ncbi:nucleoside triphosphate pyrophosphohydrolase family protein [Pseudoalteromonas ardens]|uniref:Nucleotide pyrophosphohydrolase n=1 Tax=Pseudoalteromonas rubra TaxID=43658 RepID=A0A0L0EUH7_9GAMM|nr:nucleoside triphosphate pyrophosphohydrolase family protein [Pseudoalteromonas sp. R96]KNC68127.1 hypothetical protein AC626_06530 [Pseudoalteromonas rubra]MDK1313825.1 nucleoside triphosphate pyrophosphohydrolase family protein [Pseudoalteromonas sp. R96]
MDLDKYQEFALSTAQFDITTEQARTICLLGLSGEVGELTTEFKKKLRDGDGYHFYRNKVTEELGDILWYLAVISSIEKTSLNEIAAINLDKVRERWEETSLRKSTPDSLSFDFCRPDGEKLPRQFHLEFFESKNDETGKSFINVKLDGEAFGNPLRDNSYGEDYYRYHDVFHFAYAVVLGWSPVVRKLLKCKRVTDQVIDEVEDGGRAWVIDEAISALVFEHAKKHGFYENVETVEFSILKLIKDLTGHLEVKVRTYKQWEESILLGFKVWRELREHRVGTVFCDLDARDMSFTACNR